MAREITHKKGLEKDLPDLRIAELGFTTDSEKLFIGGARGNIELVNRGELINATNAVGVQPNLSLAQAIQATPPGGRLVLNNGATYTLTNDITIGNDITIEGNNAIITGSALYVQGNFEIRNTILETRIELEAKPTDKVKIMNNTFRNIRGNVITSWSAIHTLMVEGNDVSDITFYASGNSNLNNNGSFVYLNMADEADIHYFTVKNNTIRNLHGGSVIFMGGSGRYLYIDIADNILDTIGQRGINFWYPRYVKGLVARNKIFRCGVLKAPGTDAGIGCNAIYSADGATRDVDIADNYIEYVYENGIEGVYNSIRRNTVIGTGMDLVNYYTPSPEAIFAYSANAIIEDNIIKNSAGHGIYLFGFAEGDDFRNVSIRNNQISRDTLSDSSLSGICFRSSDNRYMSNIRIDGNTIDNYHTAIELPNNKNYSNVSIGKNTIVNCPLVLSEFYGVGINIEGMGEAINVLHDNTFDKWANETTLTEWSVNNGSLMKVPSTMGPTSAVRLTSTDVYGGKLQQKVSVGLPSKRINTFLSIMVNVRVPIGDSLLIRLYHLNPDLTTSNTVFANYTTTSIDANTYQTYTARFPYYEGFLLDLVADTKPNDSWVEFSDVYVKIISVPI